MNKDHTSASERVSEETPLDDPRNADGEGSSKQPTSHGKAFPRKINSIRIEPNRISRNGTTPGHIKASSTSCAGRQRIRWRIQRWMI